MTTEADLADRSLAQKSGSAFLHRPYAALFALFIFSGVFKATPLVSWIPLDLTVLAYVASLVLGLRVLQLRSWRVPRSTAASWLLMGSFSLWVVVSLVWSPGRDYAFHKSLYVFVLCGWSFVGGSLLGTAGARTMEWFLKVIVLLALIMAVAVIHLFSGGGVIASEEWGNSYISFGRLFGLAGLVVIGRLMWIPASPRKALFLILGLLVLLSGLLLGGARGPLLTMLVALGFGLTTSWHLRGGRPVVERNAVLILGGLAVAVGGVMAVGQHGVFLRTVQRLFILFSGGDAHSAGRRMWYASEAWVQWREAPFFGHGIGSWAHLLGWGDVRAYPHNFILEVSVETGIIGLVLLSALIVRGLRHVRPGHMRSERVFAICVLLLVAMLGNALISGDLPDNRALFAMLGVVSGHAEARTESHG